MGTVRYDFSGETAVVTGGSSGIGRGIALAFAEAGAAVVVADVRADPKDDDADRPTHEAIADAGGTAAYVEADVTDPDDVAAAVGRAREFGGVDVMVNNAGVHFWRHLLDVTLAEFDRIHDVNVGGVFLGTKAAASDMRSRDDSGTVVNVASISSDRALFEEVPYGSTKGAVKMLTRGAALDLAEADIRVNAVAPGHVDTGLNDADPAFREGLAGGRETLKPIPLGRRATPPDVASATLFLASDAAAHVTGELLYVDGGYRIL